MIKEIERLNKEIDRLMTEKTKADAQKEVWENRLAESIASYSKEYGVDLNGKNLSEIKKKLIRETNIVEAKTKEEFELSRKVVNLINEGDIDGAWKLLGVDKSKEVSEEVVEEKPVAETNNIQSATEVVGELDDSDFYGTQDEAVPSMKVNNKIADAVSSGSFNPFNVQDDIDVNEEDEFVAPNSVIAKGKKNNSAPFFQIEDDEEDEFVTPNTVDKSNNVKPNENNNKKSATFLEIEDDDDFGGFGSILEGSKFKI